jgi:hypothetical protein
MTTEERLDRLEKLLVAIVETEHLSEGLAYYAGLGDGKDREALDLLRAIEGEQALKAKEKQP